MDDQAKLRRLLELIMYLVRGSYTINELSRKLGTTTRTIYRYIDTLNEAGFVVTKSDGCHHIKKLSNDFKKITDLLYFSKEEASILYSAIESIDDSTVMKQDLKRKLASIYDSEIVAKAIVLPQHLSNFRLLNEAKNEKRQVCLVNYHSAHSDKVSDRIVEPFSFTSGLQDVLCFEPETQSNKMFKVSRIGKVEMLDTPWQHESLHEEGYIDIFRMRTNDKIPVRIELTVRAANLLMEEYPLSKECLTKVSDNRWELQTEVCNMEGIGRFVIGLYDEIRIIDAPELERYLREKIQAMANKNQEVNDQN